MSVVEDTPVYASSWQTAGPDSLRALMRRTGEQVVVISGTGGDGTRTGFTVTSFSSVCLDPPLVLFCVAGRSRSWAAIAPSGRFAVNILGAEQPTTARRFAAAPDRGAELVPGDGDDATAFLPQALATALCTVHATYSAGDHTVVIGQVERTRTRSDAPPLIYHQGSYGTVALGAVGMAAPSIRV